VSCLVLRDGFPARWPISKAASRRKERGRNTFSCAVGPFVCPGCGGGRAWLLQTKAFINECADCGRQTSVTAGTIMHASKLPLTIWFWVASLMTTHANGISAPQLQNQLGLGSYRTAGMLCAAPWSTPTQTQSLCPRRSGVGKMLFAGAVEINGGKPRHARLQVIESFGKQELPAFVFGAVNLHTQLVANHWPSYRDITLGPMAAHIALPRIHRPFSNLKHWGLGVYHGLRKPPSSTTLTNSYSASIGAEHGMLVRYPPRKRDPPHPGSLTRTDPQSRLATNNI
jgi:hypothetical protein